MKANMINSLKKAGFDKVAFDEYLISAETNVFAISDNKCLIYVSIDGKNYVISGSCNDSADYLAIEMKLNNLSDMLDITKESSFIATNNGIFFENKDNEVRRIYKDYLIDNYLFVVLKI